MKAGLRFLVLASLAHAACDSTPPVVRANVEVGATAPAVGDIVRYRLVVRGCDEEFLAYANDFDAATTMMTAAQASVEPGKAFYLWLQAWGSCVNETCSGDDSSADDACRCFGELVPAQQKLIGEACTDFMVADDDMDIVLRLEQTSILCPPAPPADCGSVGS